MQFDKLEEEIMADVWSAYTKTAIDHAMNPRNVGSIPEPDGFGSVTGPCGDTMEIWLRVKDGAIRQATFWTDGCGTSIAAGSMAAELIKGKMCTRGAEDQPAGCVGCLRWAAGGERPLCPPGCEYS